MKIRKLSVGKKPVILNLRQEGKLISAIGQTLGIESRTLGKVLENKETAEVLTTKHQTRWTRKAKAVDHRNIVRAVL